MRKKTVVQIALGAALCMAEDCWRLGAFRGTRE